MSKPTYEELEDFVRELNGHNSYWWQEAGDMADAADSLVKRLDAAAVEPELFNQEAWLGHACEMLDLYPIDAPVINVKLLEVDLDEKRN